MRGHRVQCLLMGGQACVFYGAAEFSRDTDLAILASAETPDGTHCELLCLPDLVQAEKTRRDKNWPMIRRLPEGHYFEFSEDPNKDQIRFPELSSAASAVLLDRSSCPTNPRSAR
jgi:hypothetical protein